MSFKIIFIKHRKTILLISMIVAIPILAVIFRYLYYFGIEIGENWRILYENVLFS